MTLPNRSQPLIQTLAQICIDTIIDTLLQTQRKQFRQGLAISSSTFLKIFEKASSLPLYMDN